MRPAIFLVVALILSGCQSLANSSEPTAYHPPSSTIPSSTDSLQRYRFQASNQKWGFIDRQGQIVIPAKFEQALDFREQRSAFFARGKWGFLDLQGQEVISPRYDLVESFDRGRANVTVGNRSFAIDIMGREILTSSSLSIPQPYSTEPPQPAGFDRPDMINGPLAEDGWKLSEGLLAVVRGGKWGFTDAKGRLVIPLQFDNVGNFHQGLAPVQIGAKWGYIDRQGKLVIPARYELTYGFTENRAAVRIAGLFGYIDPQGKTVIAPKYVYASHFSAGLAAVKIGDQWGYINRTGQLVIPAKFEVAEDFQDGIARVDYKQLIDRNGQSIIQEPDVEYIGDFQDGLARFRAKTGWGYMNRQGKTIVPPIYEFGKGVDSGISEGLILVRKNHKYGYLSQKNGQVQIPLRFDRAAPFRDGLALVSIDGQKAYIDINGKTVFVVP